MAISVGDAVLKINGDPSGLNQAMDQAAQKVKTSTEKMQQGLKIAGAAFTAVGAAGLMVVSSARKMNAQLGQTGITLGVSTGEMRDLALATTNVTFPLESVTKTFDLLARAGVRGTEEMEAAATAFDYLGDATGASAEVVASQLIPAFKLFGVEIPKSAAELDNFTWLTKNTTVELAEFGSIMSYVAQYGDELDLTLEEMIAIMAVLESKGKSGSTATKMFRTAVTQAASGAATLNEALGITQEEIDGYREEMEEATGITEEYADMANEQYGVMDKVKQKWSELTLRMGSFLTPLEPMLAGMTALGPLMIFMGSSMGAATVKFIAHTAAMMAHTVAMVASKVAIAAVTVAQWLWNVAMTANPIGLIIIAIGALIAAIVLIVKNWDTVREKTIEIWNKIVGFLRGIWETISGFIKEHWDLILAIIFPAVGLPILIARNWGAITEKVSEIWNTVVGFFRENWKLILGILFPPYGLGQLVAANWGKIINKVRSITTWIAGLFQNAWDSIKNGFFWIVGEIYEKILWVKNEIIGLWNTITSILPGPGEHPWWEELPSFQHGGVVPGPVGQPIPIIAHGGEAFLGAGTQGGGGETIFNISQLIVREEADVYRIARELEYMRQSRSRQTGG